MKYLIFMTFLIVCNCTDTRRAGGLYNPEMYQEMLVKTQNTPIVKAGIAGQSYHSALGNLCTKYTDNHQENLICNDGNAEKQVRILQ
jgi:hypothetical protein